MLKLISKFLGSMVITVTGLLIISKLIDEKVKFTKPKTIFIMVLLSLLTVILHKPQYSYLNTLIIFISVAYGYSHIFQISIDKSIVACSLMYIILSLAELVLIIVNILTINADILTLRDTANKMPYLINLLVCLIAFSLAHFKGFNQLMKGLTRLINEQQKTIIIVFCLIEIIVIFLLFFKIEINFNLVYGLVINAFLIIFFIFLLFCFVSEKLRYQKLTNEYSYLTNYVKSIEDLMEKDRLKNHENKNQLVVIKNMTSKNNKKLLAYLNNIIEEINVVETDFIYKLRNLPKGGLQGLIYYKLAQIQKANITLFLDVSKNLDKKHFSKMEVKDIKDLCTILGIYLDNAIEASSMSPKKNISIEIYPHNKGIEFVIANTFNQPLDVTKFYNQGYTTKGTGRGYGLPLVKSIIEKKNSFTEHREIIDDYYVQYLNFNDNN